MQIFISSASCYQPVIIKKRKSQSERNKRARACVRACVCTYIRMYVRTYNILSLTYYTPLIGDMIP